jgi:hypothetical protein
MLATYHWKGLEESYNFIVKSISIKTQMKKIMITQSFEHICSPREYNLGCSLRELFPQVLCSFREQPKLCSLGEQPCSLREGMCPKLCVIITFAYEV